MALMNNIVKEVPSIISKSVGIVGNINSGESIEIEGKVEGNIYVDIVTLREKGKIKGNVKCKVFNIKGNFNGNVYSEKINISDTAVVSGVLEYSFLSVDYGANINCELKRIIDQKDSGGKIVADAPQKVQNSK
jgi:cytoskeletal protein CcmA (bactofilin family)